MILMSSPHNCKGPQTAVLYRTVLFAAMLLIFLLSLSARAETASQTIESQLTKKYSGKNFFLRRPYEGLHLYFNSEGLLLKGGQPGPWTLNAMIQLTKMKFDSGQLDIFGNRLIVGYNRSQGMLRLDKSHQQVLITIETGGATPSESAIEQAFFRVLSANNEELVKSLPSYWQAFLRGTLPKIAVHKNPAAKERNVVGEKCSRPKLISQVGPHIRKRLDWQGSPGQ